MASLKDKPVHLAAKGGMRQGPSPQATTIKARVLKKENLVYWTLDVLLSTGYPRRYLVKANECGSRRGVQYRYLTDGKFSTEAIAFSPVY